MTSSEDIKLDGELHVLNESYGHISVKIDPSASIEELEKERRQLIYKYINYLIDNNRDNVCDLIYYSMIYQKNEEFEFVLRPAYIVSVLAQYATLSLKFKRVLHDNLTN